MTSKNDKNTRTTGRPTLNEVARLAGVSPITASRALRGISTVATELVEKVQQAAAELNYVVNPAARALASAQSHSVVVLVPSLSNLLFIETLEAIHQVLRPKGFEVLIGNSHYSRDEEENLLRKTWSRKRRKENIPDGTFVHFDIPLTKEHETALLKEVGFTVTVENGNDCSIIKAVK